MENSKNFGAIIDRTLKIIKANYQKAFNDIGVDLTTEQWVLLDALRLQNGISQNDLANGSFKNAPTVSRIVDLLCKKGLTERRTFETDKRRYEIHLTELGKTTCERVLPTISKLREIGWKGLSEEDFHHFTRIMDTIFSNFDQVEKNHNEK